MREIRKEHEWQTCKLKRWGKKIGGMGVKIAFPSVFNLNFDTLGGEIFVRIQSLGKDL